MAEPAGEVQGCRCAPVHAWGALRWRRAGGLPPQAAARDALQRAVMAVCCARRGCAHIVWAPRRGRAGITVPQQPGERVNLHVRALCTLCIGQAHGRGGQDAQRPRVQGHPLRRARRQGRVQGRPAARRAKGMREPREFLVQEEQKKKRQQQAERAPVPRVRAGCTECVAERGPEG